MPPFLTTAPAVAPTFATAPDASLIPRRGSKRFLAGAGLLNTLAPHNVQLLPCPYVLCTVSRSAAALH